MSQWYFKNTSKTITGKKENKIKKNHNKKCKYYLDLNLHLQSYGRCKTFRNCVRGCFLFFGKDYLITCLHVLRQCTSTHWQLISFCHHCLPSEIASDDVRHGSVLYTVKESIACKLFTGKAVILWSVQFRDLLQVRHASE